jgi:hypothetical protein
MAGMEVVQKALSHLKPQPGVSPPQGITEKVDRGRERMRRDAPTIELCWRFFRDDTYCWVDSKNVLRFTRPRLSVGGGARSRTAFARRLPIIQPIVRHEVSSATQRVPGYEISPSTMDPDDVAAASLAKKVAYYLYDKASIRKVTQQAVTYAVVADMGFAWPYWDNDNVCIKTFGLNECYWEPGIRFDDSPWHCVEQGMTVASAMQIDDYLGGELAPDASAAAYTDRNRKDGGRNLVTVTEYLERPSPTFPEGRWLTLANGRVIAGVGNVGGETVFRPYPCDGDICIIPLSYVEDPDSDRNLGLVRFMIDLVRTAQDAWSKQLEWKNRALMPQILAPVGSMKGRTHRRPGRDQLLQAGRWTGPAVGEGPADSPGAVRPDRPPRQAVRRRNRSPERDPESGRGRQGDPSPDRARLDRTAGVPRLLAEFHSRLMRRCLELFQEYADDKRTLSIRGHSGWEPIKPTSRAHS